MKRILPLTFAVLLCVFSLSLPAQNQAATAAKPPIISLFEYLKVETAEIQKAAPHFPWNYASGDYQQQLTVWLEKYPKEWNALRSMKAFTDNGIGWVTYGIPEKYLEQKVMVNSSWYQWYEASGITKQRKEQLFPHFPELDNSLKGDTLGRNFERRIAIWEKLYPKEYIAFLNAPELKALNPYVNGEITINYMPRFLGATITQQFPQRQNSKDKLQDEFTYQLQVRNWYFVFKPQEFERRYGKDYDFPSDFSAEEYRTNNKILIARKMDPDYNTFKRGK